MTKLAAFAGIALALVANAPNRAQSPRAISLESATVADLNAAFDAGTLTSEQLVGMSLERIRAYDRQGPVLRALITVNPKAVDIARQMDVERKAKGRRSLLHGIPVVLKDNIDTADLQTSGGSVALKGSIPQADAFIVRRLRDSGAVIIGKANMSEFASGVARSSLGGQMRNPHDLTRTPLGSSGGTGISVASAFAVAGIGTDTGGSIRNPSSTNGIVGLKPTHGLVSRTGIIPLALSFDTAGPLARNVEDVAVMLNVIAAADPADAATRKSDGRIEPDYTRFLQPDALKGARFGVARDFLGQDADVDWAIEAGLAILRRAGATVVDIRIPKWLLDAKGEMYNAVRFPEFATQIADYLKTLRPGYPRDLKELIARVTDVNALSADGAGPNPNRWTLMTREAAAGGLDDYRYTSVRDHGLSLVRAVIDGILTAQTLDAIVYPTNPRRAPLITDPPDPPGGSAGSPVNLANLTGYPDLIVPAGFTGDGLPVTLSFLGPAFSEGRLLGFGYSFERLTHARRLPVHTPPLSGETIKLP
jgi:amidase